MSVTTYCCLIYTIYTYYDLGICGGLVLFSNGTCIIHNIYELGLKKKLVQRSSIIGFPDRNVVQ